MAENRWTDPGHALAYLATADAIPHRTEGEAVLLGVLPDPLTRFVDLGCGDGRLTALVLAARPAAQAVALDLSEVMVASARARFAGDDRVEVRQHDLAHPLPALGPVDAVVSSFALHHLDDDRKQAVTAEARDALAPGGLFANLEHVASPTPALHHAFLAELGIDPADEDPSNQCVPVEQQLAWLRGQGFADVDCLWRWRELALLVGWRPR